MLVDICADRGVDLAFRRADQIFEIFVSRAGIEDMDGGIDLVHARGGKSVEIFSQFFSSLFGKAHGYGGKIGVFARFDLPDHDITDDIVVVQNGRKTFQQSGVARIDVAPVRLLHAANARRSHSLHRASMTSSARRQRQKSVSFSG